MTKPKPPSKLGAGPVNPDKWQLQRESNRIKLSDHKVIPHLNSTTQGFYRGTELHYRGRQECSN